MKTNSNNIMKMNLKSVTSLILSLIVTLASAAAVRPQERHRILVSTDIGGTDADDNQSMAHLLMYSDLFDIEALVSTPTFGDGSKAEILRMIDVYEKDYPRLVAHASGLLSPDSLRSLCRQGADRRAPYCGYSTPTEGSQAIIEAARRQDPRPLYVLVWGALEDVAQALHDAPDIKDKIRVYWIGGPNKKWGANAYAYIAENFPDLWMIENNASYRGFISDNKRDDRFNSRYYDDVIKGAGALGEDFKSYYDGNVKMGDSPSLFYVMNGDPSRPDTESWGGQFQRISYSPRKVFTYMTTVQDTVPVYSIAEFRFKGIAGVVPVGEVAFTMTIDGQEWDGVYLGGWEYGVRYVPKAPGTLDYRLSAPLIPAMDGLKGSIVVSGLWPGKKFEESYPLGKNWWSDRTTRSLFRGKWQGAATTEKWREAVLTDWSKRWEWLKE